MLNVNTNLASLNAQRHLLQSSADANLAQERLASSRRINSAADDAAGLAITNRLTTNIRGIEQAIRNASDGVSLIQTIEGALNEETNILQRIRELSIQSANGIYSDSDRATLDAETQQLKEELNRISTSSTFNGQNILDGSLDNIGLHIGSQSDDKITFDVPSFNIAKLGGEGRGDVIGRATSLSALNVIDDSLSIMSINGQSVGDLTNANTLEDVLSTINTNISGVEVSAYTEYEADPDATGILGDTEIMQIDLVNPNGTQTQYQISNTSNLTQLADEINRIAAGQLNASLNEDERLVLTSNSGATIAVSDGAGGVAASTGFSTTAAHGFKLSLENTDKTASNESVDINYAGTTSFQIQSIGLDNREGGSISGQIVNNFLETSLSEGDLVINGQAIDAITGSFSLQIQAQNVVDAINLSTEQHGVVAALVTEGGVAFAAVELSPVSGEEITISSPTLTDTTIIRTTGLQITNESISRGDSVEDISIRSITEAQKALTTVDLALEKINETRSHLGGLSNRLDFTINNLSNVVENTTAARSRILDTDFAAEAARLSRSQILQDASQAMLIQANARPEQVLQLLQ